MIRIPSRNLRVRKPHSQTRIASTPEFDRVHVGTAMGRQVGTAHAARAASMNLRSLVSAEIAISTTSPTFSHRTSEANEPRCLWVIRTRRRPMAITLSIDTSGALADDTRAPRPRIPTRHPHSSERPQETTASPSWTDVSWAWPLRREPRRSSGSLESPPHQEQDEIEQRLSKSTRRTRDCA